ncbi:DivIVA domain-containing protein [Nonomuraea sp. NPDC049309]|uniref:DivIVA domain-containing protein n=1 Tax=Nonomuraea sp. NPDC049309 TaxID=3364350 RepID=UPI00371170F6
MHADLDYDVQPDPRPPQHTPTTPGRPAHDQHLHGRADSGDGHLTDATHTIGAGSAEVLTPAAVHHQVFSVVRLREGYNLAEVDAFLTRVESSLAALWRDNKELGERLDSAQRAGQDAVEAARLQAEQILAEAYAQAEQVQREALTAAETLVHRACSAHRQALEDQIDQLETTVAEHGRQLQHGLTVQVTQLRGLLQHTPFPIPITTTDPWPRTGESGITGSAEQAPL